jgi:hypothetical protein
VFCLLLFTDLLQEMKAASDMFQKVAADVSVACDVVDTLMASMTDKRNEDKCHDFVLSALDLANRRDLVANRRDLDCNILTRKRNDRICSALKDFVVTEAIGRNESSSETIKCFLCIEIFVPVLDKAISELTRRFCVATLETLHGVDAFVHLTSHF